jgi:enediyne biosynthesis protein E4
MTFPVCRFTVPLMLAMLGMLAGTAPVVAQPAAATHETEVFRDIADEVGLHFDHVVPISGDYYFPEITGSGVALLDYDKDGCQDVLALQLAPVDPNQKPVSKPAGWKPGVRLFHNDLCKTGKLHFTDVTEQAGIHVDMPAMGVAVGDYDGSGYPSIYITGYGRNVMLHNNGDGTFTDVTAKAGVAARARWGTGAAFCELRKNKLLDLIVTNYVDYDWKNNSLCYTRAGERDFCSPRVFRPVPITLFRNNGDGTFTDVTRQSGLTAAFGAGFGVSCADFSGEGRLDFYVANDGNANQLWHNKGDGTFEDVALLAGAAYGVDGSAQAGMGVAVADYNNSGRESIVVTNMVGEGNNLYTNEGGGNFRDVAADAGLLGPSLPFTGFGVTWLDYDNSGLLDLFIGNGAVSVIEAQRGNPWPFVQRNQLFHNTGHGFVDISDTSGPAMRLPSVARGVAVGDLDNDGAMDLVVSNSNGPMRVLHNELKTGHHWLGVSVDAVSMNHQGLGAQVGLLSSAGSPIWRRVHSEDSFLSASDTRVHFGLGDDGKPQNVVVRWLDGTMEIWRDVAPDHYVTLKQGTGSPWSPPG